MTVESHVFDKKARAVAFRDKKNKTARTYHWVMSRYMTGWKVSKYKGGK